MSDASRHWSIVRYLELSWSRGSKGKTKTKTETMMVKTETKTQCCGASRHCLASRQPNFHCIDRTREYRTILARFLRDDSRRKISISRD